MHIVSFQGEEGQDLGQVTADILDQEATKQLCMVGVQYMNPKCCKNESNVQVSIIREEDTGRHLNRSIQHEIRYSTHDTLQNMG